METHQQIHLYLDNDPAGIKCKQQALQWSQKFIDQSHFYKQHKDLNELITTMGKQRPEITKKHSRGF